ncbi:MAG: lysophospholipase [Cellulosilyticaceae bacterium]
MKNIKMKNIKKRPKVFILLMSMLIIAFVGSIAVLSVDKREVAPAYILEATDKKTPEWFISEAHYDKDMVNVVEPYLEKLRIKNILETQEDNTLYYEKYCVKNPKAVVVISHGFSEWIEKYNELIYYFAKNGYSVYIPSHRGHGYSTRMVEDLSMVHIDDFDSYVNDLSKLIEEVVIPQNKDEKIILFGHSMGGGISTLLLEDYPDLVDVAVLSSPMVEVKLPGIPNFLGKLATNVATILGFDKSYIITHGPFTGIPNFEESSTQSKARYMYYFDKRLADTYCQTEGASFGWLKEAIEATEEMIKNVDKIKVPTLLFQAEQDTLVKPGGQNMLTNASKYVELILVLGGKHDLYFEKDTILVPYLQSVFSFLEKQLKTE